MHANRTPYTTLAVRKYGGGRPWEIWSRAMTSGRQRVDIRGGGGGGGGGGGCPTTITLVLHQSIPGVVNNERY